MSNAIKAVIGVVEIVAGAILNYYIPGAGNGLIAAGAAQLANVAIALLTDPRKSPLIPIGAAYAGASQGGWATHLWQGERRAQSPSHPAAVSFERGCRTHLVGEKITKIYPRFRGSDDLVGPFRTVGGCMHPYVKHGSLAWADSRLDVRTGEIVLARDLRNDKVFCKVLERIEDRHVLTCNEPELLPISRFEIIGPVVMIVALPVSEAHSLQELREPTGCPA